MKYWETCPNCATSWQYDTKARERQVKQIAVMNRHERGLPRLFALCVDGTMWQRKLAGSEQTWEMIEGPPAENA